MKGKSKVSPEDISSDSSDSEDSGLFKFLHTKRRKLDKEILSLILEPEKSFIEHRYNGDMSYIIYMEASSGNNIPEKKEKDGQTPSTSTKNKQTIVPSSSPKNTNKPFNFLLKGTTIPKSSKSISRPNPPFMQREQNQSQISVVKRVPGSLDLHSCNNSSIEPNKPSVKPKPPEKQIKSRRGCSVS